MSCLGFVLMCHTALHRSAQVARYWAERDCPVVLHVDKRADDAEFGRLQQALAGLPNVRFCKRHRCEWGTWGIVAASQSGSALMLADFPEVQHVYLASGACLPLRPVADLRRYLAARPETDFIESVTIRDMDWTVGGLNEERFALRFPFAWKRQRYLFDRYVDLQRRVGFRRKLPPGLEPHLGSQWWCLTRQTLSAILEDPDRPALDRFFKRVWIPDESYYQTLARPVARRIESRSLTLSKFDFQGKPHIFYDDHLHLLRRSDCFMARKIWPSATLLYDSFLSDTAQKPQIAAPAPATLDKVFSDAMETRTRGRPGLYMQSRFPNRDWENGKTAGTYTVFHGFNEVFDGFEAWLSRRLGTPVHGHLFDPARARFADGADIHSGCLSANAALRDHNPEHFLANLIRATRGTGQVFQFGPRDRQRIGAFLAEDSNARIFVITGAWALRLLHADGTEGATRQEAARLQKRERDFVARLRDVRARAHFRVWSLADFVAAPMDNLRASLDLIGDNRGSRLTAAPSMADLTGLPTFLQTLRNDGLNPVTVGEVPPGGAVAPVPDRRDRPYLVR